MTGLVTLPTREMAPPLLAPAQQQQLPDSQHIKARAINLARFYNARLDSSWQSLSGSWRTLSGLVAGRHILGEIEYDVRGIIQLSGLHFQEAERPRFPTTIDGIPVGQDLARFHFLLGTAWPVADGTTIAAFTVHFEDGVRLEIPIIYGEDVRDWNGQSDANTLLKRGKLAWGQRIAGHGVLRLFQTFWANPRPSAKVRGLDFRSMNTESAPFLLAVSAEI
jgi:hypothetical protein